MKKTTIGIIAVIIVVAILAFTALFGLDLGFTEIRPLDKGIKQGLDLVGGSEITYKAVIPEGMSQASVETGMETAITMLRQRLNALGYTEANVYRHTSNNSIVLEVPDVQDPQEAVSMLGATAVVEFRDYLGNIVLDGKDIKSASAQQAENQAGMPGWIVKMELTDEGYERFKEGTKIAAQQASGNNYVEIFLDNESISKPGVDSKYASTGIDSKEPIIELGNSDRDYALYLAEIIKAGSLPFTLETGSLRHIGAQLGEDSLNSAILAGIIGIILVMLYMLVFYRLSGFIADIALCVYILLFMVTMSAIGINLTLPGIAGLVLTVGMAVDANVIIYERMREELALGRSIKGAIDAGFKRAFGAIFDGNLTTLIAAFVLLWQGTGTILSFAKTLAAGVILSMLCMLILPRLLLTIIAEGKLITNPKVLVSIPKEIPADKKLFSFVKAFKFTRIISGLLVATALVGLILLPFGTRIFNLDHDFIGGVTIDIDIGEEVTRDVSVQIEEIATEVLGFAPSSVSQSGNAGTTVTLKMRDVPAETWDAIYLAVTEEFGGTEKVTLVSCEAISPSIGRDITRSAFIASILAALLILIYIAFRFELRSGVSAIIALLHDVMVMLSFYIIFQIPMNMNFIAAVLTVVGYSINATIVIFDRIRENNKRGGSQVGFSEIVDKSIRETVRRSIGTTFTTLAPLIVLIVLSVSSVRNFGIPIVVGLLVGCYSSMFLAGPLWNSMRGKKSKNLKKA